MERFKGRPTREQRKLLARISNLDQRRALLTAIENGEDIPTYAWTPITEEIQKNVGTAFANLQQGLENARRRCREEGTAFDDLVEFDPEGAADAIKDDDRLTKLIGRMKATDSWRRRSESMSPQHADPSGPYLKKSSAYYPIVNLFVKIGRPLWATLGRNWGNRFDDHEKKFCAECGNPWTGTWCEACGLFKPCAHCGTRTQRGGGCPKCGASIFDEYL